MEATIVEHFKVHNNKRTILSCKHIHKGTGLKKKKYLQY